MNSELIIAIGGLVLSVLTYFAGVWRTERRYVQEDREIKIQRVFERYMEFRKTNQTGGTDGLLKAGVATLDSDAEIQEVVLRIVNHGQKHPLGKNHQADFGGISLTKYFKYAAENNVNILRTTHEEIVEASGARA
jgi:hypothetical protein